MFISGQPREFQLFEPIQSASTVLPAAARLGADCRAAAMTSKVTVSAEEMGSVLKRSSYSPIIRDMDGFSCAMFTANGDLVAQADYIPA